MGAGSVELSQSEWRVATVGVILLVIGQVVLRAVGNTTDVWRPSFALLGVFVLFVAGFTIYLAKSRRRSLGSLLALGLPDRLRRRSE